MIHGNMVFFPYIVTIKHKYMKMLLWKQNFLDFCRILLFSREVINI